MAVWRHRVVWLLAVWLSLVALPGAAAGADVAAEVRALTGARTRLVWVQDTGDGRDTFARGRHLRLLGFDSDDGRGERVILAEASSYSKPLLTPGGDHIVFSDHRAERVCVIAWDGSGRGDVAPGTALEVWRDPKTGQDWVYAGTKRGRGKGATFSEVRRFRLDRPGEGEAVWDRTAVSRDGFAVSADGTRAGGLWPWPSAGVAELPNRSWAKLDRGCWTGLSPDNSYLLWVFDGAHRNVRFHSLGSDRSWKVSISGAPGIRGFEVYHPRWSNHVRFLTMTGPYLGKGGKPGGNRIRDGGRAVEVYLGRFDARLGNVERWVRVSHNDRGDFFPDAWIEGGEKASVAALAGTAVEAVLPPKEELAKHDTWPANTKGLEFLWEDAAATNQIVSPDGEGGRTCRVEARGHARFGRFHEMVLGGGAMVAQDADDALLQSCRRTNQLSVEALVTPANIEQGGPARIVTFSSSASSRNFTLGQEKDRLVFRLRTPQTGANGTNPQVDLCRVEAGKTVHVIVSYVPGRLLCYVDGRQAVATPAVRGDFGNWTPQHLLFGDEFNGPPRSSSVERRNPPREKVPGRKDHSRGRDWAGRLEGIAVFSRSIGPEEAKQRCSLASKRLEGRGPAERAVVRAKLVKITPTPDLKGLDTYRRCLALYSYDVEEVLEGRLEAKRIAVAHWVVLDLKVLPNDRRAGGTYRLTLEPWDDHPQLDSERLAMDDFELLDLPRYYHVGPP